VLVGESLSTCINYVANAQSKTAAAKRARALATSCKALITNDQHDGKRILDVFGQAFKDSSVGVDVGTVEECYQRVLALQFRFRQKKDAKLEGRYGMLRTYCESRTDLWGVKRQKA
jgi:hypothetical protein